MLLEMPDFSAGRPMPGTRIQIRDIETLEPLDANSKGEICLYNTSLFQSYFNNPEVCKIPLHVRVYNICSHENLSIFFVRPQKIHSLMSTLELGTLVITMSKDSFTLLTG